MTPLSPHRAGKIGSSQVAALFGVSPYLTRLQLYAHHADGFAIETEDDERMRVGRLLQDDILELVAARFGFEVEPNDENSWVAHPDPDLRAGATVDAFVRRHESGLGVVEVKNVDRDIWLRQWTDDTAPRHIELQLQHQLLVTGAAWGMIAALVGGNELVTVPARGLRHPLPDVHREIEAELRAFWREVAERRPPEPQAHAREIAALAHLYQGAVPEPVLDLSGDSSLGQLIEAYEWAASRRRECEALEAEAKVKILARLGDFQKARGPDGAFVKVTRSKLPATVIQRAAGIQTRLTIAHSSKG